MKNRYSANDPEITRILANCRTIYLIGHWAQYGYLPLPFSGEYKFTEPLVWMFNDHNGTYDEFILIPITKITTGYVIDWTFDEEEAKRKVKELNEGKVQL
jgi:hypothetical protein